MKRRLSTDSMARDFRSLRNRIESEIQAPALVFVTSATERDGASFTARGLAESLGKTHQRAVLMTTDGTVATPVESLSEHQSSWGRRAGDRLEPRRQAELGGGFSVVTIAAERAATMSRSAVAALVQRLRSEYDYVVVDAADLPKNSFNLLLLSSADATLITFRSGRSQQPADRAMLDILERAEAKVLGVVMTEESEVDTFIRGDEAVVVPERAPRQAPSVASAG